MLRITSLERFQAFPRLIPPTQRAATPQSQSRLHPVAGTSLAATGLRLGTMASQLHTAVRLRRAADIGSAFRNFSKKYDDEETIY